MNRNNLLKALGVTLFLTGCGKSEFERIMPLNERTARENVTAVVQEQEKTFGIKYSGEPKISFEPNPWNEKILGAGGRYNPCSDEIWISQNYIDKLTISHELAHHYTNQLLKKRGIDICKIKQEVPEDDGRRLVYEGIAAYFEIGEKEASWDTTSVDYKNPGKYEPGNSLKYLKTAYSLVKPILDKDLDKGIIALMKETPGYRDLKNLLVYRRKILSKLDRKETEKGK